MYVLRTAYTVLYCIDIENTEYHRPQQLYDQGDQPAFDLRFGILVRLSARVPEFINSTESWDYGGLEVRCWRISTVSIGPRTDLPYVSWLPSGTTQWDELNNGVNS